MGTVLITGAAGYIGSFTANLFLSRGYRVLIVDNLSTGWKEALPKGADFLQLELLEPEKLRENLSKYRLEGLIHFAAKSLVAESVANPDLYFRNNVDGTRNLVGAVQTLGVEKIIFSSTAAVYGEPQRELSEDHPTLPVNPYGESKLRVEEFLAERAKQDTLKVICLRYFNACGASSDGLRGERHKPETHLIPLCVGAALGIYPPLKVFGSDYPTSDGSAIRDYIHVEDLAEAHLAAYKHLDSQSGVFFDVCNVGTGRGFSVLEVIASVERVVGKKVPREKAPRRSGDPAILVANSEKIQKLLGWRAARSELDEVVQGVNLWMSQHRELFG